MKFTEPPEDENPHELATILAKGVVRLLHQRPIDLAEPEKAAESSENLREAGATSLEVF